METLSPTPATDERWRMMLTSELPHTRRRRVFTRIPSAPHCKLCAAPFTGLGGLVLGRLGHRRWPKNPKYCEGGFQSISANHGGAQIEGTILFAAVRGSPRPGEPV